MRVVADTSILVRANVRAKGPVKELFRFLEVREPQLVLSDFLLDEVARVLAYPRIQALYGLSEDEIAEHVRHLRSVAEIVTPYHGPAVNTKDSNDDPVIYTALAGRADVPCTLDQHFSHRTFCRSVRDTASWS